MFLTFFEKGALHFHFIPSSTNYVASFVYHSLRKNIKAEVWGEIYWIWFGNLKVGGGQVWSGMGR